MEDQQENLETLEHLVTELSSCGFALDLSQHQDRIQNLKKDFTELQKMVKERWVLKYIGQCWGTNFFLLLSEMIICSFFTRKSGIKNSANES